MIGCIIQARMSSTRLPGKIFKKLNDDHVLSYVINQLRFCKTFNKIIVATTTMSSDDVVEDFCKTHNIHCFRGDKENVLDRYYKCAQKFKLDTIVRITADCPLIDHEIVDHIVSGLNSFDYVSNNLENTFPKGYDVEVFTFDALKKTWEESTLPSEKEHVTQYMKNNSFFDKKNFKNQENLSYLRCTLDHLVDLEFLREVVKRIHTRPIVMKDVISVIKKEPHLMNINKNIDPNEGLMKSYQEDEQFKRNLQNEKN